MAVRLRAVPLRQREIPSFGKECFRHGVLSLHPHRGNVQVRAWVPVHREASGLLAAALFFLLRSCVTQRSRRERDSVWNSSATALIASWGIS